MSATEVQVLDAMKALLEAADFGTPVTVTREYLPVEELAASQTGVFLTLTPASREWTPQDRSRVVLDSPVVHVAVRARLTGDPADDDAAIDGLLLLSEAVMKAIAGTPISFGGHATTPDAMTRLFTFHPKHLAEYRQFTTIVAVTYSQLLATTT